MAEAHLHCAGYEDRRRFCLFWRCLLFPFVLRMPGFAGNLLAWHTLCSMLVSAWLVFVGGMGRVLHLRISVASQNCVYGTFLFVRLAYLEV